MKSRLIIGVTVWLIAASTFGKTEMIKIGSVDGLDPTDTLPSHEIALALSGGGARGLATIGVLRAFEQKGIKITAVSGTSMGGVVGGLYACGYSPSELEEIINEIDFSSLFSNSPARSTMFLSRRRDRERHLISVRFDGLKPEIPRALTAAQQLTALLTRLTNKPNYVARGDFSRLPIPFKTVGTDIVTGDLVVFSHGSLANALRATLAFPLAFTAVEQGDSILMDGGMLMPIPVEIVRNMVPPGTPVVAIFHSHPPKIF